MSRTGWILLFVLIAVCAYATVQKEGMVTANGRTLGPSTNVGDTAYAKMLKRDTGQGTAYGEPPPEDTLPVVPEGVNVSRIAGGSSGSPAPPPTTLTIERHPAVCPSGTFVPGKACIQLDGSGMPPYCASGLYIEDPTRNDIGMCETRREAPKESKKPVPGSGPQPPNMQSAHRTEGTPAKVAPTALTGLQVGGPNDGGIGPSPPGSGNASWGAGRKYPNLLGPDPKSKKDNLPDNNMTANLTLPTPCQVGADGNTLYSPGCRAPTDLGYFDLPKIPKTDGDPSPFSGDYTVFMR